MRLLPSQTTFPLDINVFSLSSLTIVSLLFILARGIVAGATNDPIASLIITVAAITVFFVAGFCIRFFARGQQADDATSRTATWLFLCWIISIVIVDLTDVPLVLSGFHTLGYYLFWYFPTMFLQIEIRSGVLIDFLRALLLSLIVWCLLLVKTKIQAPPFLARTAFTSWQFPIFVGVNALLLLIVILTPY